MFKIEKLCWAYHMTSAFGHNHLVITDDFGNLVDWNPQYLDPQSFEE